MSDGTGDALDALRWREEILQALFWMRGEGLAEEVSPGDLVSFLAADEAVIAPHLERLADAGDLRRTEAGEYALSEAVIGEAGALFARDFQGMVNASAHGTECSRPDCACHSDGPEHCESQPAA